MPVFDRAAFVGSGLIGAGLAAVSAAHNVQAVLYTRRDVEGVQKRMNDTLDFFAENGLMTQEQRRSADKMYRITTSVKDAVQDMPFVQESGPEKIELKRNLIREIEEYANPETIIASSTSYHTCTELQEGALYPERIICAHPWHPSYLLPLIELMCSDVTSAQTKNSARTFYEELGRKVVVLRKDVSGYIGNTISLAVREIAQNLVADGVCSAEDVDATLMNGPGARMAVTGQLLTMNLGTIGGLRNHGKKFGREENPRLEEVCQSIDEEMAARPIEKGRDWASISKYRDRTLLKLMELTLK